MKKLIEWAGTAVAVVLCLAAALLLCAQILAWLRSGHWTPAPLELVWEYLSWTYPRSDWVKVQDLFNWLLGTPLWMDGLVVGWFIYAASRNAPL